MRSIQSGFTLIELVVVIVLLGILGVTASAKYADLSTAAANATAQGVASEITAGSTINYGAALVVSGGAPVAVGNLGCNAMAQNLLTGGVPTDITISGGPVTSCGTVGNISIACTSQHTSGDTPYTITLTCTQ